MDSENAGAQLNILPGKAMEPQMLESASGKESDLQTDNEPDTREEIIREGQQNIEHVHLAAHQAESSMTEMSRPQEQRELSNVLEDFNKALRENEEMLLAQRNEIEHKRSAVSELRERIERLQTKVSQLQRTNEQQTAVETAVNKTVREGGVPEVTYGHQDFKNLFPDVFQAAVNGKIQELIERMEAIDKKARENEIILVKELDDVEKRLNEKITEVEQMKSDIENKSGGQAEKQHLQKSLDQRQREVELLKENKQILEERIKELTAVKDEMFKKACDNEICLVKELDDVEKRLREKEEDVERLQTEIKSDREAKKHHLQKRLRQREVEVGILTEYKEIINKRIKTSEKAVEIAKNYISVNGEVSELRLQLKPFAAEEIELQVQSHKIKKKLDDVEKEHISAAESADNSAEGDLKEITDLELQNIEKAIQDWTKTMASFIPGQTMRDADNNIIECQRAAQNVLSILNAHFQKSSTASTPLQFGLKTAHILEVMTDKLAGVITWKDWPFGPSELDQQGILRVLESEQETLDGRVKDCEKAFGESSAYYKYVAAETAANKETVNSYIEWLNAI